MMTVGFDPATKTGWGIVADGKVVESGVQDFGKQRGESNGIMFLRARKFFSELLTTAKYIKENNGIAGDVVVAYERAHYRGGAATEICVGIQTRVQEAAAAMDMEAMPVQTTVLKKWATGKGNAGKPEMIGAAKKFLGREPIDDNEADAILISLWAYEQIG